MTLLNKMNPKTRKILSALYYDTKKVGSFSGLNKFFDAVKGKVAISRNEVKKWLQEQDVYTVFKSARKKFQRLPTVQHDIDAQWQGDLMDLSYFANANDGFKYLLVFIDILSRYAWVMPLRTKSSQSVIDATEKIFQSGRIPRKIQTDMGKEFNNFAFKSFLAKRSIIYFTTTDDEVKASVVERLNRTLRSLIYKYLYANNTHRYIEVLGSIVETYNNSYHRGIKMKPSMVTSKNKNKVFKNLYSGLLQKSDTMKAIPAGSKVRIHRYKGPFEKGVTPSFTEEIFNIDSVVEKAPRRVYKLSDSSGEKITSIFYPENLSVVRNTPSDKVYKIEKVIKTRNTAKGPEYFVKWVGWPSKFNSWVSDLKEI